MIEFRTQGFNGHSVKYSPFFDSRLAVAAGANFGLVGNGRLYILGLTPDGRIVPERWFDTQDCLYDTAWSEAHENQLLAASGDGSIKLFDLNASAPPPQSAPGPPTPDAPQNFPVASWSEHAREVLSVSWNLIRKDVFASSSWDGTIKIWNPARPESQVTLPTHNITYSAQWSPHSPDVISSVGQDSHLRVFDLRTPASAANHLVIRTPLHSAPTPKTGGTPSFVPGASPPAEALTHDWNKYRDSIVATAGVDRAIRTFDIRAPQQGPIAILSGHRYAVRKLSWSPHLPDLLLSASYDMTCRVWTDGSAIGSGAPPEPPGAGEMSYGGGWEMGCMARHTEFVLGVDWCLFGAEGWCASTGWDERVLVWDVRAVMGP